MNRIIKEWEEHKGEFVLTQSHTLERFIAIGDDSEDYYYVTYDGRRIMWNSCVGKLIYLKGKIDDKDYQEFIRLAKLNHLDQADENYTEESANKHREDITKIGENHLYLTEICWDLN
jgi:hypothetical protein